jgi:hypothetical protein
MGEKVVKIELINECRHWWRLASVQLAAVAATIAGVLTANPGMLQWLVGQMPDGPWRTVASVGVAVVVFIIPTLARLVQQPKLKDKTDASGT